MYKILNVLDMPQQNLIQYFEEAIQFIRDVKKIGGKVFVHCFAGVSRSATIVIAYLMGKMSLPEAYNYVKTS